MICLLEGIMNEMIKYGVYQLRKSENNREIGPKILKNQSNYLFHISKNFSRHHVTVLYKYLTFGSRFMLLHLIITTHQTA